MPKNVSQALHLALGEMMDEYRKGRHIGETLSNALNREALYFAFLAISINPEAILALAKSLEKNLEP